MKRIISLALVGLLAIFALVGCGKDKTFDYDKADLSKYLKLGQYRGIEVEVEDRALTDEDIEENIDAILTENGEKIKITDRAVADGDSINLDYSGSMNGVKFDGGTAKGAPLVIGSDSFIPGFEDGLIGVMPGETVDLNLTFPKPYLRNPDLAGASVVFTVTVNHIDGLIKPEWNDEFVKTLSKGEHETTEAYVESLKPTWAAKKKAEIDNKKVSDVWGKIVSNSEVIECPKSETDKYYNEIIASYESYADQYKMDLDAFLAQIGTDRSTLEKYAESYAKSLVTEELIFHSIVKDAELELGEEEYNDGLAKYAESYDMTVEELKSSYGEDQIKDSLLWDKMIAFVTEYAIEKPAKK